MRRHNYGVRRQSEGRATNCWIVCLEDEAGEAEITGRHSRQEREEGLKAKRDVSAAPA